MPEAPTQPTRFGEYLMLKRLAVGGMAEIFWAQITGLAGFRRDVALKKILPDLAGDRRFVEMMLDEARIAARLLHPNIVQVINCGVHENTYFIVMEYVRGQTLRRLIRRVTDAAERLTLSEAMHIGLCILRALGAAHDQRDDLGRPMEIVHRDVTPENVLVSYNGEVKLTDFGIARAHGRLHRTRTGNVKGKLAYMAPEQLRGRDVSHRTDQFSAALVLIEALTGLRAYFGQTEGELFRAVYEGRLVDLETTLPAGAFPEGLAATMKRALSRDPQARFPSCTELADHLTRLLDGAERASPSPGNDLGARMRRLFAAELEAERRELDKIRAALAGASCDVIPQLDFAQNAALAPSSLDTGVGFHTLVERTGDTTVTQVRLDGGNVAATVVQDVAALQASAASAEPSSPHNPLGVSTQAETKSALVLDLRPRAGGCSDRGGPGHPVHAATRADRSRLRSLSRLAGVWRRSPSWRGAVIALGVALCAVLVVVSVVVRRLVVDLRPHGALAAVDAAVGPTSGSAGPSLRAPQASEGRPSTDGHAAESAAAPALASEPPRDSAADRLLRAGARSAATKHGPGRLHRRSRPVATSGRHSAGPERAEPTPPSASPRPSPPTPRTAKAPGGAAGTLDIACLPWCNITVNGNPTDLTSPVRAYALPAGEHEIEAINPPTGKHESRKITVVAGEAQRLYFRFR